MLQLLLLKKNVPATIVASTVVAATNVAATVNAATNVSFTTACAKKPLQRR